MWLRDHVRGHDLANSLSSSSARIDSAFDSSDIATHDGSYETRVDLFPTDEANVSGFHHRIGGFDHRHQATAFNHSECFRHRFLQCGNSNKSKATKGTKLRPQKAQRCF